MENLGEGITENVKLFSKYSRRCNFWSSAIDGLLFLLEQNKIRDIWIHTKVIECLGDSIVYFSIIKFVLNPIEEVVK